MGFGRSCWRLAEHLDIGVIAGLEFLAQRCKPIAQLAAIRHQLGDLRSIGAKPGRFFLLFDVPVLEIGLSTLDRSLDDLELVLDRRERIGDLRAGSLEIRLLGPKQAEFAVDLLLRL